MNVKHRSMPATEDYTRAPEVDANDAPSTGGTGSDEIPTPVKTGDIPGLGPIRARALVKAGFTSAMTLHAATLEQLKAVPGMSEIKARHIQTYLAQFSEQALCRAAEAVQQQELIQTQQEPQKGNEALLPTEAAPATAPSPVEELAHRALQMAMRLLMTEPATGYRARLLRETIGFMRLVALLLECGPLAAKAEERGLRRLNSALEALTEAAARPDMDRKEQTRLADQLAQIRERLEALVGQTLRHAPHEAEDE